MDARIIEAAEWLQKQVESLRFGQVSVTVVMHNGIRRIDRSYTEKIQKTKLKNNSK